MKARQANAILMEIVTSIYNAHITRGWRSRRRMRNSVSFGVFLVRMKCFLRLRVKVRLLFYLFIHQVIYSFIYAFVYLCLFIYCLFCTVLCFSATFFVLFFHLCFSNTSSKILSLATK